MEHTVLETKDEKLPGIFQVEKHHALPTDQDYVLFRYDHQWKAMGPTDETVATALVRAFHSMNIRCFICLEEEFRFKGLPSDSKAVNYFPENELSWE